MKNSIGKTIRRLRVERGYTQEDLAELLSVSPQTVSKWENDTNTPDISLIVPLATTLSVTTDTLFGLTSSPDEDFKRICSHTESLRKSGNYIGAYRYLREELKLRPNYPPLLLLCLQYGGCLSITDTKNTNRKNKTYDPDLAPEIYRECIKISNTFFEHAKDIDGILWAHVLMTNLHASHGHYADAEVHAKQFPQRADLTINWMMANIAQFKNDNAAVVSHMQSDFSFKFQSVLDSTIDLASALFELSRFDDAVTVCKFSIGFIEQVFADAPVVLRFWERDCGNFYVIAAKSYLALNNKNSALDCLKEYVRRETAIEDLTEPPQFESTLFGEEINLYCRPDMLYAGSRREHLIETLNDSAFDPIRDEIRCLKV